MKARFAEFRLFFSRKFDKSSPQNCVKAAVNFRCVGAKNRSSKISPERKFLICRALVEILLAMEVSRRMGAMRPIVPIVYRYLSPYRVGFLRRFCLKTGIHFALFVWNWVWFSRELRECMNIFIVSIPNE